MHPQLREAVPTTEIDPMSIAPDPGEMGPLYIEAREFFSDGMLLACSNPKRPYAEIVEEYTKHRSDPGFSPVNFWNTNFDVPKPEADLYKAPDGMSLDEYTLDIRPRFIHSKDDIDSVDVEMPYDRSVAGAGRSGFGKHSFLWDGYHMAVGYRADKRWDLILNIADNTEYQINTFGYGLNGSAKFYTRSQPPYFSHEVSMLSDEYGDEALVRYLPAMEKEYRGYWMDGKEELSKLPDDGKIHGHRTLIRLPLGNGKFSYLNRYWDDAESPRLESYKEDVELGEMVTRGLFGAEKDKRLKKLYRDIRAGAASGHDYSSRWFENGKTMDTINTTDILPVDLNSLLARTEQMLARAYHAKFRVTRNPEDILKALEYEDIFRDRVNAINIFNYDPKDKIYRDFNWRQKQQTSIVTAAMSYPLYVGISNEEQTLGVADAIENQLLFPGGVIATTTVESSQQWDGGDKDGNGQMNVWAPLNWSTARGLGRMAHILKAAGSRADIDALLELAERVKGNFSDGGIQIGFDASRFVREKHRGDDPTKIGRGGEYAPVDMLAMTGEIWRAFKEWDPRDPQQCLPIGAVALKSS